MADGTDNKGEAVGGANGAGEHIVGVPGGGLQPAAGSGQGGPGAGATAAQAGEAAATAEIVPGVPEAAVPEVQTPAEDASGINKIGKNHFAAVYIPATEEEKKAGTQSGVVRFTDQEAAILTAFMRSADYEKTAVEVGIKTDSVKRILRRPNLKRYILFQIRVHTVKEIDPEWAKAEILPVWAGEKKVTDDQKWAMSSIIKLVMPKGAGVQVNVQQNSIYGGMSRGAIDAEWVDARTAAADGV